jgi:AcrR family transcriptional regulator
MRNDAAQPKPSPSEQEGRDLLSPGSGRARNAAPVLDATGPEHAPFKPDRRVAILDAAERCFARSGFHQASMHEICAEAGMSPGNLYRYFPSKDAIIAGIADRNRAEVAEIFDVVTRSDSFFDGLAELARQHIMRRSDDEIGLCTEVMAERRRNPAIAEIFREVEVDVKAVLVAMLARAAARAEISPKVDFNAAATVLMALADGLSWRRASDPAFDADKVLPLMFQMVHCMLTQPPESPANEEIAP